jgi:hypothetical protein
MTHSNCNGDGSCLYQEGEHIYEKNTDIICLFNCEPVKCPNYLVCGNISPQRILSSHKGTCFNCRISFGHLEFFTNEECPICLDTKLCVKQSKCNHKICVDCFKRCHFPPYWNDPQPQFPYDSELEDEYESQFDLPRWKNDPLIQKYQEDCNKWELERQIREKNENYLKRCSICRQ